MGSILWGTDEKDIQRFLPWLDFPSCTGPIRPSKEHVILTFNVENYKGDDARMLNAPRFVRRARSEKGLSALLKTHHIPHDTKASPLYRVLIFQYEVIAILRKRFAGLGAGDEGNEERWEKIVFDPSRPMLRKLRRLARKTLYLCGLDYGMVAMTWDAQGEEIVVGVDPCPTNLLNDREIARDFSQAMNRLHTRLHEREQAFLMGADLEFVMCNDNGHVLFADRYFGRKGSVGSDSVRTREQKLVFPLGELRPRPAADPRRLMIHLRRSLLIAARKGPKESTIWKAGGMPVKGLPLGGHLHFSGISLNPFLVRALDNYMALPLILAEDDTAAARRPRYGFPGDVQEKKHGGFEYRTLPSWMVSPRMAKGVIALAYTIIHHYWELRQRPLDQIETAQAYYRGDKKAVYPIVQHLWKELEALYTYKSYAAYLTPLKKQLFQKLCWDEQRDFRHSWKIPPDDLWRKSTTALS